MSAFRHNLTRLIVGAVVLSTSAPWVKLAEVPPTTAGIYRMAVGTTLLVGFCLVTGRRLWGGLILAAMVGLEGLDFASRTSRPVWRCWPKADSSRYSPGC